MAARKTASNRLEFFTIFLQCLKVIRKPSAQITLIGLVKEPEIAMAACQPDLEFGSAPIRADEIEFIAATKISRSLSPLDQVQVQKNRNLEAGQALPINVPDASHKIEPLVRPAHAGTRPKPETGRDGVVP